MPTTRPRHMVTETDDVVRALDAAAHVWPDASRAELVRRLLVAGADAIAAGGAETQARARSARLRALDEVAGIMTGVYPAAAREHLRDEWPR